MPIIEYACIAVTPLSITARDRLERIQSKAARICLRLPLFTPPHHSALLHWLKWRTMSQVFSSQSKAHPSCTLHKLPICTTTHTHAQHPAQVTPQCSLRHTCTWRLPPTRTDRCKDSPLYKSLEYYNALPASIRDVSSRPAFKQETCSLLINSICSCSAHPFPYL